LIVDPINHTNNIGSNTFNMYKVKAALESAYNSLVSTFDSGYSYSVLGRILIFTKRCEEAYDSMPIPTQQLHLQLQLQQATMQQLQQQQQQQQARHTRSLTKRMNWYPHTTMSSLPTSS
jgi:hypothetical protein